MLLKALFLLCFSAIAAFSQVPVIEGGVSQDWARWRAAHYSDIRYKLNLTLEKMSPVLKGTLEIRVKLDESERANSQGASGLSSDKVWISAEKGEGLIMLDWRKIRGNEILSTISNVSINGKAADPLEMNTFLLEPLPHPTYTEYFDHLIFWNGVPGENVIKLDFTSPILTSGSAITRYIDKEDGAEYIYSLFVPSDASTAFPVFDQPDLKARFSVRTECPPDWNVISNSIPTIERWMGEAAGDKNVVIHRETQPISSYVFAFAAGPWAQVAKPGATAAGFFDLKVEPVTRVPGSDLLTSVYVRKSQLTKFNPHGAEVFRLNREAVKYLETYFDYKFPFPKYDLVLIPEFPFGGMEHAGATFLREQSVIFPQEPTKNDIISRANLIFHEAAHQWFGDTVTMRWFDDLWLKEGFATFMAYKALEKIMPEANAWKVFYERVKQNAYQTDSTRGTTAIYQPIANLNSAKSAYGNIVYNKAPAFLRQAEFYLGEDKFQTAVRAFLKKHEFANAGWEDLVTEFQFTSGELLKEWSGRWIKQRGMYVFRSSRHDDWHDHDDPKKRSPPLIAISPADILDEGGQWAVQTKVLLRYPNDSVDIKEEKLWRSKTIAGRTISFRKSQKPLLVFPNYQDYGYGIFLLDDKSRDYVLKNIQKEKDDFLRTMMWGSLWDSVREGELDPKEYVELVIKNIALETDEGTIQTLLTRVTTAMNYYLEPHVSRAEPPALAGGRNAVRKSTSGNTTSTPPAYAGGSALTRLEDLLIDKIQNASTQGQRITYYRAFLNIASTDKARDILKQILKHGRGTTGGNLSGSEGAQRSTPSNLRTLPTGRVSASASGHTLTLKTKDKFDIVTRLAILSDPDAPKLLAELEKAETSDDAKRYAYAARAAFATVQNKAMVWNDFINNKTISESWIEAAFGPFNSIRRSEMTLPYLEKALAELPTLKRSRKIFFVNGWLAAFIGGQTDEKALRVINKFLTDNPNLDSDLRLKILENVDVIERAVKIRSKYTNSTM